MNCPPEKSVHLMELLCLLILSFSFINRYFIAWKADYIDHMYLNHITIERKITLKDTLLSIGCCKLISLLITVCINWLTLQPCISFHIQRWSRLNHKHSSGFRQGPVASTSSSLAQWHIFALIECAVVSTRAYIHANTHTHMHPSSIVNFISQL